MAKGTALLETYMAPLEPYLKMPDIIDICIQEPETVRLQTIHGNPPWIVKRDKKVTFKVLNLLAEQLATAMGQQFSEEHPILFTTLPKYGYRIVCMGGSVVESGFCLSIRASQASTFPLESYFDKRQSKAKALNKLAYLNSLTTDQEKVIYAVENGLSMAVVGGTGSGKTTLLNSIIPHIPQEKRIIAIEDSAELVIPHKNHVRLLKAKTGTDIGKTTYKAMINASLRLNPDIILMGELDIENTVPFLRISNTGHSGAMTTVHANSPIEAYDAMTMNAAMDGYPESAAMSYSKKAYDTMVFIERKYDDFNATFHRMKNNNAQSESL